VPDTTYIEIVEVYAKTFNILLLRRQCPSRVDRRTVRSYETQREQFNRITKKKIVILKFFSDTRIAICDCPSYHFFFLLLFLQNKINKGIRYGAPQKSALDLKTRRAGHRIPPHVDKLLHAPSAITHIILNFISPTVFKALRTYIRTRIRCCVVRGRGFQSVGGETFSHDEWAVRNNSRKRIHWSFFEYNSSKMSFDRKRQPRVGSTTNQVTLQYRY